MTRATTTNARNTALVLGFVAMLVTSPVVAEYADVVLNKRADAAGVRPVVFPHWFHRMRYRCNVCHTELKFEMRAGANTVLMKDIVDGKFCGACHNDKIAWGAANCDYCHSGKPGLASGIYGGSETKGPGRW